MSRNGLYLCIFIFTLQGCGAIPPQPPMAPSPTRAKAVAPRAASPERAEALLQALLALGIDYRPGGQSPASGFDCSGLVAHVFREAFGIDLPHNTRAQSERGQAVSLAEAQAGDLLFYNTQNSPSSHVGIYLGDGRFVHAPKAGARVRVEQLESPYWRNRFNGVRRVYRRDL